MFVIDAQIRNGELTRPFCFIGHPKTGTQSIRQALRKAGCRKGSHHGFDEEEIDFILNNGGVVVSTVRNPFDLTVSWWAYGELMMKQAAGQGKPAPFDYWLPRILESGNGWIEKGLFYAAKYCNRIIRFEHDIELQLNRCLTDCGLPPVTLEHVGKSPHDHYTTYYGIKEALLVDRYFRPEISEWGYEFGD